MEDIISKYRLRLHQLLWDFAKISPEDPNWVEKVSKYITSLSQDETEELVLASGIPMWIYEYTVLFGLVAPIGAMRDAMIKTEEAGWLNCFDQLPVVQQFLRSKSN